MYTVVNTKNAGTGSLRTAIQNANAVPGSTIGFAIPTTDPNYDPATGVFSDWFNSSDNTENMLVQVRAQNASQVWTSVTVQLVYSGTGPAITLTPGAPGHNPDDYSSEVTTAITIDGKMVTGMTGETLFDVAWNNGVRIPRLCHVGGVSDVGACRLCLVEITVRGRRRPGILLASPPSSRRARSRPMPCRRPSRNSSALSCSASPSPPPSVTRCCTERKSRCRW